MADLTRCVATAEDRTATDQQTGTDSVADLDQHEVVIDSPEAVLGKHSRIGIVGHQDGQCRVLLESFPQRKAVPAEVGSAAHHTVEVDDARRADADAEDRGGGQGDDRVEQRDDESDSILTGCCAAIDLCALPHIPVKAENCTVKDAVVREVEADDLECRPVDIDERCRLARTHRLALAQFDDEPLCNKVGDQV